MAPILRCATGWPCFSGQPHCQYLRYVLESSPDSCATAALLPFLYLDSLMKKLFTIVALGMSLALGAAHAADDKAPSAQQNKMKTCNADAKDKKGDERKAFMKECLSNKPVAAEPAKATTQQEKMKTCNADAKDKKGDERKAFMKECLSAK
jgi:hypothetical protein